MALDIGGRKRESEQESIIYFKARVYLLQTNCSRGSALQGVLSGERAEGLRDIRACLSIRLYQKNTVATALKIRDGVWGGGCGGGGGVR